MNAYPIRWRAIAAILASSLTLAGCSNTAAIVPAVQPPAGATTTAPEAALVLPRGTRLDVRLHQAIDVKHAEAGDRFTGTLAESVVAGNAVAVPAGSNAVGEVLLAHKRGKFKGRSALALTLTRLEVNGTVYRIDTATLARSKKGKGKRTAAFIGGGAGMGMLIGGIATGGVGLLVGGLAGGGAGALGAAFTGNRDLSLPAESVVTFRLQESLTLAPDTQVSSLQH